MGKILTFARVQASEARAAQAPERAHTDAAAIRAGLIASGVLRPQGALGAERLRPGVYTIDCAAVGEAARTILASRLGPVRLAAVVEQADPRIAARLKEIAALRGVQLAEAA